MIQRGVGIIRKKLIFIVAFVFILGVGYLYSNRDVVSLDLQVYPESEFDQALSILDFTFDFPKYNPAGFVRNGATVHTTDGYSAIAIDYHIDTKKHNVYRLVVAHQPEPLVNTIQIAAGFIWEEIKVHDSQSWLGTSDFTDEKSILFKTANDIQYQILSATLSTEEMIKILESI